MRNTTDPEEECVNAKRRIKRMDKDIKTITLDSKDLGEAGHPSAQHSPRGGGVRGPSRPGRIPPRIAERPE